MLHHIFPLQDRDTLNTDWGYNVLSESVLSGRASAGAVDDEGGGADSRAPADKADRMPRGKATSVKGTAVDMACRCAIM